MARLQPGPFKKALQKSVCVFLSFSSLTLAATTGLATGLHDVYLLAEENDPAFRAVHYQKMATDEGKRQAIAHLLPMLAGSAGYTYTSQDVKQTENDVYTEGKTDYDTTSYGLVLTQPIFDYGLYVGVPQSEKESLWAAAGYVLAQQELIVRTTDLYLQALAARDQLDYANAEHIAVDKHLELASERFDLGLVPITDLYDAKARSATNQAVVIEAENLFDDAMQALEEIVGQPSDELNQLRSEISLLPPEPADLDSWIEAAIDQNPAIEMRRHAVEVVEYEVSRQKSGHYPVVNVVGRYNNEDSDDSIYGGGSEFDTFDVSLRLTMPFYQGGLVSSRVREASYQLSAARQELVRQERAVSRRVRSAYLGVTTALSQVEALAQSVTANQLALEAKQEGFLSGLYTSLNVLDAERDLSLISIDYARARYRYVLNSLKLKAAVGSLNPQDLIELDDWFPVAETTRKATSEMMDWLLAQQANSTRIAPEQEVEGPPIVLTDPGNKVLAQKHDPERFSVDDQSQTIALVINGFQPNSLELSDILLARINQLAGTLAEDQQAKLLVTVAYGDSGRSSDDMIRPEERALYVQKILAAKGVAENRVEIGETHVAVELPSPALRPGLETGHDEVLVVNNDRQP